MEQPKPKQGSKNWWMGLIVAIVSAALGYFANGCTAAQVQQAQDVKGKAKNLCEERFLQQLAPILLTEQQASVAIEAARYACAAAESQCIDEALKFRQEQLELQAKDAGPPAQPVAPVPEADAAFEERK